jgi:hypothetical protein
MTPVLEKLPQETVQLIYGTEIEPIPGYQISLNPLKAEFLLNMAASVV